MTLVVEMQNFNWQALVMEHRAGGIRMRYYQTRQSTGFHSGTCNKIVFLLKENISHFPQLYVLVRTPAPSRTTSLGHQRTSLCEHSIEVWSSVDLAPHSASFHRASESTDNNKGPQQSHFFSHDLPHLWPASGALQTVLRGSNKPSNRRPKAESRSMSLLSSHERCYF